MVPIISYEPELFSLAEAAKRFNQPEEFFLQQGASEFVELIIRVPATAQLGVRNLSGHSGSVGGMRHPDFLKLSLPDISEIRKSTRAAITGSPLGLQLLQDGDLRKLTAHDGWEFFEKFPRTGVDSNGVATFKDSGIAMTEWTIRNRQTNEPIFFERSDIRIYRSEFQKMKDFFNVVIDTDLSKKNSPKLNELYNAAQLFWGKVNVDLSDRDTYPDPDKIQEWFITAGFSKSLAEAAVTIITPDGAKTRGPKLKTKSIQKITVVSSSKPKNSSP